MINSENIGRGLSLVAGATMGYLINKVQEKPMPADFLGYTLKTTGSFFLGQYAKNNDEEIILRAILAYWSYETLRLTPIGKPKENEVAKENPATEGSSAVKGLLTAENMQNVGSALKGISSLLNGLKGN